MTEPPRIYTPEQANQFIPQFAELIPDLNMLRQRIIAERDKHDVEEIASFGLKGHLAKEAKEKMASIKLAIESYENDFESKIDIFEKIGCDLKSIEPGLVDFFGQRDGNLIYLCWKEDESEISFWHPIDSGFAGTTTTMTRFEDIHKKLTAMKQALEGTKRLIILSHDHPDPDGISAAFALKMLVTDVFKIPSVICYTGLISRAENQEMIRLLKLKMKLLSKNDLKSTDRFALVDCQPNTGNVSLPAGQEPLIVIDHHPLRKATKAAFMDVQDTYGATATVLGEYLLASAVEINSQIATALCYALSTETQQLGRGATPNDISVYSSLFTLANKKILSQIENPPLPRSYYKTLSKALHHASMYKHAVISNLGEISAPDFVPIVADLLLKCERITWSLCMGRHNNKILLSVRTSRRKANAGAILRSIVGKRGTAGGHEQIAGGQITCKSTTDMSCDQIEKEIKGRFLKKLGYKKEADEMIPFLIESTD